MNAKSLAIALLLGTCCAAAWTQDPLGRPAAGTKAGLFADELLVNPDVLHARTSQHHASPFLVAAAGLLDDP